MVIQKKRYKKKSWWWEIIQTRYKRQIFDATCLLSSVHNFTLAGFLFDLDQSNVYRDIQKIKQLVRKCLSIPQKTYDLTKRLKTLQEVEKYFPGLMAFID